MQKHLYAVLHPEPEVGKIDTSLRYTDILFGFVIKELFVRLQNWSTSPLEIQWQLTVGTVLVLCSWIGFRRSLNRTSYEVKFFNLPLMRFIVDQLMLILYFRVAVMSSTDGVSQLDAPELTDRTLLSLVCVFALYGIWDLLGVWMCKSRVRKGDRREPRYPIIRNQQKTEETQAPDWYGFAITAGSGLVLYVIWISSCLARWDLQMLGALITLVLYRFVKEIRTSWRNL